MVKFMSCTPKHLFDETEGRRKTQTPEQVLRTSESHANICHTNAATQTTRRDLNLEPAKDNQEIADETLKKTKKRYTASHTIGKVAERQSQKLKEAARV
ncbi:hypothetical protein F2Q70_00016636 [Brassica cretica]|uniref:Uncharacterized protein n=1 Tax=Brassica cretica TaxID=69181 RepID=A0A8S9HVL2_BRACR|nr:hypothetical protein F2Q70_00016636 [Brassica cretica]KAF2596748.1 hypothetical protein F2Q68_00009601 [Brassica cretica]